MGDESRVFELARARTQAARDDMAARLAAIWRDRSGGMSGPARAHLRDVLADAVLNASPHTVLRVRDIVSAAPQSVPVSPGYAAPQLEPALRQAAEPDGWVGRFRRDDGMMVVVDGPPGRLDEAAERLWPMLDCAEKARLLAAAAPHDERTTAALASRTLAAIAGHAAGRKSRGQRQRTAIQPDASPAVFDAARPQLIDLAIATAERTGISAYACLNLIANPIRRGPWLLEAAAGLEPDAMAAIGAMRHVVGLNHMPGLLPETLRHPDARHEAQRVLWAFDAMCAGLTA